MGHDTSRGEQHQRAPAMAGQQQRNQQQGSEAARMGDVVHFVEHADTQPQDSPVEGAQGAGSHNSSEGLPAAASLPREEAAVSLLMMQHNGQQQRQHSDAQDATLLETPEEHQREQAERPQQETMLEEPSPSQQHLEGGSGSTLHTPLQQKPLSPRAPNLNTYPVARATHEEVTQDPQLFKATLRDLHNQICTKFRVPIVAGQELDLHLLYKQVTSFGGLDAVMSGKKWSLVCEPFKFPITFTSRSFTMRKIYSTLLFHYEQVYFLHNTGPLLQPPKFAPGTPQAQMMEQQQAAKLESAPKRAKLGQGSIKLEHYEDGYMPPRDPPALIAFNQTLNLDLCGVVDLVGHDITGVVDARFDCGYFVTLSAAGQEYKGILYRPSTLVRPPTGPMVPSPLGVMPMAGDGVADGVAGGSDRPLQVTHSPPLDAPPVPNPTPAPRSKASSSTRRTSKQRKVGFSFSEVPTHDLKQRPELPTERAHSVKDMAFGDALLQGGGAHMPPGSPSATFSFGPSSHVDDAIASGAASAAYAQERAHHAAQEAAEVADAAAQNVSVHFPPDHFAHIPDEMLSLGLGEVQRINLDAMLPGAAQGVNAAQLMERLNQMGGLGEGPPWSGHLD